MLSTRSAIRERRHPSTQDCAGAIHLPILVDDKVEAIIEFGSEELIAADQEVDRTLWLPPASGFPASSNGAAPKSSF